ncbi:hypothetical protein [Streptomyces roseochromogenus]|uniref:Uncharacterized protein n=1 Tax=Streptomyces roseochromogenus subsp. oscitans DS 12.976 TaxID=1352936 RepID=V6K5F9_STRRC|nr:hypothetical protein [Streptomyces roseochromogenus]EST24174.1 hypothetical protein M878_31310 [Streptomyces roseochromogenus subsp. oscitans DS 12.976]
MTLTAVDLFPSILDFRSDGGALPGARRMTEGDLGSGQVAAFPLETGADVHADRSEAHPGGEEAVCCLCPAVCARTSEAQRLTSGEAHRPR